MCKQQELWKVKDILYVIFQHLDALHRLYSHIYFSCNPQKQLNGDLIGITFVMLAIHEQVALMSSQSETCLVLYVQCTYLCVLYIYVYIYR